MRQCAFCCHLFPDATICHLRLPTTLLTAGNNARMNVFLVAGGVSCPMLLHFPTAGSIVLHWGALLVWIFAAGVGQRLDLATRYGGISGYTGKNFNLYIVFL